MAWRLDDGLDLTTLAAAYAAGVAPIDVVDAVLRASTARGDDHVWIGGVLADRARQAAHRLAERDPRTLPLYGVPFALKDNIDVQGLTTTAACPGFAYTATATAPVVTALEAAGAILIGKTNLDQFATGLSGCRSPYGIPANALAPAMIPGGSSSGSAVAVAAGLVSFALGTDTAGSGRVPAMLNNLVGLKPTRGLLSTRGVVPACRSLDCVSIFALSAADAAAVLAVAEGFDPADPFARAPGPKPGAISRLGIPRADDLDFDGDQAAAALFEAAVARAERLGFTLVEFELAPFVQAAKLLYDGPWVAERTAALQPMLASAPDALHPVTRQIVQGGLARSAVEAFEGAYRLAELRRATEPVWNEVDALLLPTAPTAYTIEAMLADPIRRNSRLGHYTNFMNLFDLAGVTVPAGFLPSGAGFGVTLVGPPWSEAALLAAGDALHRAADTGMGASRRPLPEAKPATPERFGLVVCGAHMRGLALNHQLTERGGRFVEAARTAPCYRLYALAGTPSRPGMVRVAPAEGAAIEVELWDLPAEAIGGLLSLVPAPLGFGQVHLADGRSRHGFVCEAIAAADGIDITHLGGWRAHLAATG
ncbi:MAG: allophanate hydrolase [Geminicoccaceae bacterium]|nr:MAG: allophanate hydrolase [Geminicoccaceae bacterium]